MKSDNDIEPSYITIKGRNFEEGKMYCKCNPFPDGKSWHDLGIGVPDVSLAGATYYTSRCKECGKHYVIFYRKEGV